MSTRPDRPEKQCAVSGIGQSDIGRRLGRDPLELTLDACYAAVADAGLKPSDINGLSTYPGNMTQPKGFTGRLGLRSDRCHAPRGGLVRQRCRDAGPAGLGDEGDPRHRGRHGRPCPVLPLGLGRQRAGHERAGQPRAAGGGGGSGGGGTIYAGDFQQWMLPFGSAGAPIWVALYAQAHMDRYGTTSEQLAQIAINGRRNAGLNPKAIYREPLTLEDYFNSRMITTPLHLFDCDVPCDGATAFVISRRELAQDLAKPPVYIEAMGTAIHDRPSWDQLKDLTRIVGADAATQMWGRTDLTPADVDIAQIYDGFSYLTMLWLEALQLCGMGESGPFVEGGTRIARDGALPLNTAGGQLSAGRLHGYGFLHEACVQLRGEGGERQVPKTPKVAAVAAGGGNTCGCLLVTTEA